MIARLLLSLVLLVSGILHILNPELFFYGVTFSGIVEIFLGLLLWIPHVKELAAKASALWFLILFPVHLYMSVMGIPMFGISHKLFLWGLTLLQPALYFWSLSLQEKGWIMSQRWSHVAFLHYEVDKESLQKLTPFPLDLFEGKAIVSIVPFTMSRIRFPFLPPIPGLSKLLELNLRTYVRSNGKPAVYFFTLDSNHLPGVLIARWFFALPYRWIKLKFNQKDDYEFSSPHFELKGRVGETLLTSAFDLWATERYALYTKRGTRSLCGIVGHSRWVLRPLEVISFRDDFSSMLGSDLKAKSFRATAYSQQLDVRFRPFHGFIAENK